MLGLLAQEVEPAGQTVFTGAMFVLVLEVGLVTAPGLPAIPGTGRCSKNIRAAALPPTTSKITRAMLIHLMAEPRLAFGAGTGACAVGGEIIGG